MRNAPGVGRRSAPGVGGEPLGERDVTDPRDADRAWRESLRSVTIAQLARTVDKDYNSPVMATVGAWLAEQADA